MNAKHRAAHFFSVAALCVLTASCGGNTVNAPPTAQPQPTFTPETGQFIFRMDTFGDEQFWTNTLQMNRVIQSGVSPKTALGVGLKVDADALPADVIAAIKSGNIDLNSPATTVALLKLNAVVGVIGKVDSKNNLTQMGISCALCHSTVDNRVAPGIGSRIDRQTKSRLESGGHHRIVAGPYRGAKSRLQLVGPRTL